MQIDLEPQDYSVKGRREPILHRHWKAGVLAIICVFLFAMFVMRPLSMWWFEWSHPFFDALVPGK